MANANITDFNRAKARKKVRTHMRDWPLKTCLLSDGMSVADADAYIADVEEMFIQGEIEDAQENLADRKTGRSRNHG